MVFLLALLIIILIAYYFRPIQKYCIYKISCHENSAGRLASLRKDVKNKKISYQFGNYVLDDGEVIHSQVKIFDSLEAARLHMEFCKQNMNVQGAFYQLGCVVVLTHRYEYLSRPFHELVIKHILIEESWRVGDGSKT